MSASILKRLAFCLALSMLCAPRPVASSPAFASFDLGEGVTARLGDDGVLVITCRSDDPALELLRLDGSFPGAPRGTAGRGGFLRSAREGDAGGHRGFTRAADDDGDGQVDEDRLDGRDNDGDGRIDEDHAAIGHAMTAWHDRRAGVDRHLEVYHWTYSTITSLLGVAFTTSATGGDPLRVELPSGEPWSRGGSVCPGVLGDDDGPVFLARVQPPGRADACWLGLAVLDAADRRDAGRRVRVHGSAVAIPPLGGAQDLVVAVGASRLQVIDDLASAAALRDGVSDPVTDTRMPWVPQPPARALPRDHTALVQPQGAGLYALHVPTGGNEPLRLDPDLLATPGASRPQVRRLAWLPEQGTTREMTWPPRAAARPCRPYADLEVAGAGTLVFTVSGPAPAAGGDLAARLIDGRTVRFRLAAHPDPAPANDAFDRTASDVMSRLSPDLLVNYPNPFRFETRISYRVPRTVGEAFDLDDPEAPPLEPSLAMPYGSDPPRVEVTVFSLEGRIVARLQADDLGPGLYEVGWNGRDLEGRLLPSGAYFCKLQIENWSVTKRLIFVR
jgi:hypothetical protein